MGEEIKSIPVYKGEIAVKATYKRLPRHLITIVKCPICGTTIKLHDYADRRGFHVRYRYEGIRKCKHFLEIRGAYGIFQKPE